MSSSLLAAHEPLSAVEVDRRLEQAIHDHERAEKLICFYLNEMVRRRLYEPFGFENVYDYALERFGFCNSKTRALLFLARRLARLPRLTEALAEGKLGWTKAAKAASVATPETDEAWAVRAVEHSYRDLEKLIRDEVPARGGRLDVYVTAEQGATWQRAVEICRRLCGEEVSLGLVLEYVAGEFVATYEALAREEAAGSGEAAEGAPPDAEPGDEGGPEVEIDPAAEERLCPESTELPSPTERCYADVHREVLERDGWRCQYPGCSVRRALHVHHVTHRSRFGHKRREEMNHPSNLVVVCWFHHRMLHAELLGLTGRAPGALEWRRPEVMETEAERHERLAPVDDFEEEILLPNVWRDRETEDAAAPHATTSGESPTFDWMEPLPNVGQQP